MPAVGLTDHGTMFGVIEFYNAAFAAGIKPIIGVEAYLSARGMEDKDPQLDKRSTHLLLLAENETGYRNLLEITSAAQLRGFYYFPRVDHEFLAAHSEGLICTTGCMAAEIPRAIQDGNLELARKKLDWYYDVFGPDRFYFEMQSHNIPELTEMNKTLLALGKRYQGRYVATNDVHYVDRDDARLQDIMLAIQTGCVISDPNRMRMSDDSYYLRSPDEMSALFGEIPGAIDNTIAIAERCHVDLSFKGYRLPQFDVPEGYDTASYLRALCEQGLVAKYGSRASDAGIQERLNYELDIIHGMGFDAYFLIVWDLCRYAKQEGVWYNARGSAAGSIVAYTLDITMVDPIEHGLIFERFLNPGRVSMPDIDLDFRDDMRSLMMEYCARKYGEDKVAQIITFGTLKARAAIRDVGRVLDIPLPEVDRIAKQIPNIPGKPISISEALEQVPDFKKIYDDAASDRTKTYVKELIDTASNIEGVVRNAGTHAAGVIIADKPIIEYIPLHRPTSNSDDIPVKIVTQFEMSILDSLGLLKVDFLGLATLTVMARACDMIKERHGIEFNLNNIPVDDQKAFELLGRGDTAGVFQVEGAGMRRYLMQMKPQELANVIAMVALYRPGPLEFIPTYIRRMHGEEKVEYRHKALEDIFEETYGIPVYQEQIMRAAVELAGYTASEADDLRKAIAKKQKEKLLKHREKFIKGISGRGQIPAETGSAIFDDWEEFARYGFNKAHAADYGVIAVQTAFLKAHYPAEYLTALMSVNKNDTDKVALYCADSRRLGILVLPPDVNTSEWDFSIEDSEKGPAIRFGLGAVKNVGQGPVEAILNGRKSKPFKDLNEFARRVDLRNVGRRALESLIRVGALDCFGSRLALLEALDRILAISASHFRAAENGQMSLFGTHTGVTDEINIPEVKQEIPRREVLNWERELMGLYVSDHPLSPYMELLNQAVSHFSGELNEVPHGERVRVAGLISRIRPHQTKTGKSMGFVTIEDIQGIIDLVVFPKTWEKYYDVIVADKLVLVDGKVDAEGSEPKILVDNISTEFKMTTSLDESIKWDASSLINGGDFPFGDDDGEIDLDDDGILSETSERQDALATSIQDRVEQPFNDEPVENSWDEEDVPPPPDAFPEEWEQSYRLSSSSSKDADAQKASDTLLIEEHLVISGQVPELLLDAQAEQQSGELGVDGDAEVGDAQLDEVNPQAVDSQPGNLVDEQPSEPEPLMQKAAESAYLAPPRYILSPTRERDDDTVHMVTVVLRSSGDKVRDQLRIRRIYGTLISYHGKDRFAFQIFEQGRGYLIEFPNDTTGYCPELMERIRRFIGQENVRIEKITFQ